MVDWSPNVPIEEGRTCHVQYSDQVHSSVGERYARRAPPSPVVVCDSCDCSSPDLYPADLLATLPKDVTGFSLGCGNPIDLARLRTAEVIWIWLRWRLIDCFFASNCRRRWQGDRRRRRDDQAPVKCPATGHQQRRVSSGFLEALPIEDASIDVVISNA
jgi:hypothetical protein